LKNKGLLGPSFLQILISDQIETGRQDYFKPEIEVSKTNFGAGNIVVKKLKFQSDKRSFFALCTLFTLRQAPDRDQSKTHSERKVLFSHERINDYPRSDFIAKIRQCTS